MLHSGWRPPRTLLLIAVTESPGVTRGVPPPAGGVLPAVEMLKACGEHKHHHDRDRDDDDDDD